jgi:hypothetical protein
MTEPTPSGALPAAVTLLTQPDCSLCEHAKRVLAAVAADHPLTVTEIPLDSPDGQRLAVETGMLFAPGILVDGAAFGFGRLSERALRKALTHRTPAAPSTADTTVHKGVI